MQKKNYITVSLLLFSSLWLFFSCTQEDIGIFYSLEIESELEEDKGLEDELKVWEMVRTDITDSEDSYFIAAGKVFSRPAVAAEDSTVSWSDVSPPAEGMLCSDIVFFNSSVFALFRTSDGTVSNLYVYRSSADPPWELVDVDTSVDNERIMGIIQVSDTMYVEKFEVDAGSDYYKPYSLWYSTDGSSFNKCSINNSNPDLSDDISLRLIFDGDFDGTNYMLVSGNAVYRSTDGSSFDEVTLTDTGGTAITFTDIGGVYYSDTHSLLFLSSKSGFIYANDLASDPDITANWNKSTDLDDSDLVFYDFSYIPSAEDGTEVVIVGSDEGYYEIPSLNDLTSITPRKPGSEELTTTVNYLNTALSNGSIRKFFVDSAPDLTNEVIFALTTSNGLWQNRLIDDADPHRVWTRE